MPLRTLCARCNAVTTQGIRTLTILHRSKHRALTVPHRREDDTERFPRTAPHLFDETTQHKTRRKGGGQADEGSNREVRGDVLTRSTRRGSSSPESAPFPPPATNSQRSRRARAVRPPAAARGAARLRRLRAGKEGVRWVAATVETAIGMRGSAPSSKSKAAASARCPRGENGNFFFLETGKGEEEPSEEATWDSVGRTPRLEIRETVGFRDSGGSIARSWSLNPWGPWPIPLFFGLIPFFCVVHFRVIF